MLNARSLTARRGPIQSLVFSQLRALHALESDISSRYAAARQNGTLAEMRSLEDQLRVFELKTDRLYRMVQVFSRQS